MVFACSQGPEDYSQQAGLVDALIKAKEDKAKEGRPASGPLWRGNNWDFMFAGPALLPSGQVMAQSSGRDGGQYLQMLWIKLWQCLWRG